MFNSRFSNSVRDLEASGIRKIFEAAGPGSVNMGIGQPDFDTPEHIKKAAIKAINDGFTGYTPGPGYLELRNALSNKFKTENEIDVGVDEIIVTSGASEAIFLALSSLINPGDEVLIPNPGFVSYSSTVKILNGKVIGVSLNEDMTIDVDSVLEQINPKTKALIMNSPGNPTGAVESEENIKALAEIATDMDITIISDEVYEHFIYEGVHKSPAKFSENVITVNACSKTYAMTGWRIGYAAADVKYIEQMGKVHQYVQACANSIAQKAAYAALTGPQDSVKIMRDEFLKRRDILISGLKELQIECNVPKGAFYAFPKVENCEATVQKLLKAGLITTPGTAFGTNGKDHIRLSYACSIDDIEKGLEIMEKVL
ncbi:MAG: pyridoxal phosphate-dependent aminotransferase [Methanosarcinaceae archaeon]|nr:pyridoxal phosphate-dependent aminotransferase [Methanosarcinaceae archaeon]